MATHRNDHSLSFWAPFQVQLESKLYVIIVKMKAALSIFLEALLSTFIGSHPVWTFIADGMGQAKVRAPRLETECIHPEPRSDDVQYDDVSSSNVSRCSTVPHKMDLDDLSGLRLAICPTQT